MAVIDLKGFCKFDFHTIGLGPDSQHLEGGIAVVFQSLQTVPVMIRMAPVARVSDSANVKRSIWPPDQAVYTRFQALTKSEKATLVLAVDFFYKYSFNSSVGNFSMNHLAFVRSNVQIGGLTG